MSSRGSILSTGAAFGAGVHAECVATRDSVAAPVALRQPHTKTTVQEPFRLSGQRPLVLEDAIRLEERSRERARIVHELHDTLFQGFLGASMLLDEAMDQTPSDSPSKPALSRALHLVRRAIEEGRAAIRGLPVASLAASSLEQAFANFLDEVTPVRGVRLVFFVQGKSRVLKPAIQDQLFLIGREAVINALRHSEATKIEVEVQYMRSVLYVLVRDNGRGISPALVQKASDSHWGLHGMRDRAENIGAQFDIWSRPGSGTEVCVTVPFDVAMASA